MKIEDFHLLKIITCWMAVFVLPITSICEFPSLWSGKWFQSGLQQPLQINISSIETKGTCIESDTDRYLLEDKVENCRRCVVIHEKHFNVLQYKETFCFPQGNRESLDALCEKITGDAPLYSMFRLDAKPITCPFIGGPPFTFTYNRGSGDCKLPVSKSDSCTDDSRMLLRYQACPDVHNSESTVEELTCLAWWRDGSMKYMVGKLEHKMTSTDEDRYRCFVYNQGENNVYDVAQSGDATCNGLPSATEGSRTMKLSKGDVAHHEKTNCKLPHWLTEHHTWHLLDHSKTYHFSSHNGTIRVTSVRDDVNVLEMRAVCNSILASSEGQIIISAHITVGCDSGYRCMAFYRRDGHVIEVQQSTREVQNSEEACSADNFNPQTLPYTTLITPYLKRRRCPFLGRYTVSNNDIWKLAASTKQMRENMPEEKVNCEKGKQMLSLGCTKPETMEFQSECNSDVTAGYSCHGNWEDSNGTSYLIAIPLSEVSAPTDKYCFVIYNAPETTTSADGSRRGRRLQLYSLTKTCRRDLHQDTSDQNWMFNITHHADCDGIVNGGSSSLSRSHISFVMCVLVPLMTTLAALITPEHISR